MSKLKVIDFWAQWCGPCKMLGPVFESVMKEFPDRNGRGVEMKKDNVDDPDSESRNFNVRSIPTIVYIKDGVEVGRTSGVQTKEAILKKIEAETAKDAALNDLDIIQKRSQTELISTIVKVALGVIMGVGVITTIMYSIAIITGKDTQMIGSTWSNMFGILLTNAFSIVGTIMGVKYASENKEK